MNAVTRPLYALATLLAVAAPAARAQARPQTPAGESPKLAVTSENRTATAEAARGKRRPDAHVRAGDVLHYRLTFANTAGRPIRNVVLSNPLPAGLRYVGSSSRASRPDAVAEYSADRGRTFSARPMETVVVNGRREQHPVAADRYTNVRWTVSGWLAPDSVVVAEYDATLGAVPNAKAAPADAATPATPAAPASPAARPNRGTAKRGR